jgi:hypothetical protein
MLRSATAVRALRLRDRSASPAGLRGPTIPVVRSRRKRARRRQHPAPGFTEGQRPGLITGLDNGAAVVSSDAQVKALTITGPACDPNGCSRPNSEGIIAIGRSVRRGCSARRIRRAVSSGSPRRCAHSSRAARSSEAPRGVAIARKSCRVEIPFDPRGHAQRCPLQTALPVQKDLQRTPDTLRERTQKFAYPPARARGRPRSACRRSRDLVTSKGTAPARSARCSPLREGGGSHRIARIVVDLLLVRRVGQLVGHHPWGIGTR